MDLKQEGNPRLRIIQALLKVITLVFVIAASKYILFPCRKVTSYRDFKSPTKRVVDEDDSLVGPSSLPNTHHCPTYIVCHTRRTAYDDANGPFVAITLQMLLQDARNVESCTDASDNRDVGRKAR